MSDGPFLPKLLLPAGLILIRGFFAAAEAAITALPEAKLKKQAEDGDKQAEKLLRLTQTPDWYLSAIQTALTLTGFLAAAFAAAGLSGPLAAWLAENLGAALSPGALNGLSAALITIALSYFGLVLGDLAPRRIASARAEAAARFALGPMSVLAAVHRPLAWLLSKSANGVLRLFRIDPEPVEEHVSEDEILMMVDLGEERGAIETSEKELIENIFQFNNTTAKDVMVHRTDMVMVQSQDGGDSVLRIILSSGRSRLPVYEEDADHIVGMLNTRDFLLNAQEAHPKPLPELLRPAYFVPESVRTDSLFRDMQSKKIHMAIVVDEYGGTSGLVTMEDLLEEIVGSIYDEFDPVEEKDIEQAGPGLWRVSGSCGLERLAQALEMEFPEEESDTLGGLVFAQLSVIPEDGAQLEVDACGLHIKVLNFTERRVEQALVSRLEPAAGAADRPS